IHPGRGADPRAQPGPAERAADGRLGPAHRLHSQRDPGPVAQRGIRPRQRLAADVLQGVRRAGRQEAARSGLEAPARGSVKSSSYEAPRLSAPHKPCGASDAIQRSAAARLLPAAREFSYLASFGHAAWAADELGARAAGAAAGGVARAQGAARLWLAR